MWRLGESPLLGGYCWASRRVADLMLDVFRRSESRQDFLFPEWTKLLMSSATGSFASRRDAATTVRGPLVLVQFYRAWCQTFSRIVLYFRPSKTVHRCVSVFRSSDRPASHCWRKSAFLCSTDHPVDSFGSCEHASKHAQPLRRPPCYSCGRPSRFCLYGRCRLQQSLGLHHRFGISWSSMLVF